MPLADKYRPKTFDDMVGQQHLVGPYGLLRSLQKLETIPSMIFYGTPGCGKTTAALIFAENTGKPLHKLNAVSAGSADIKKIAKIAEEEPVILYLDEIQYFNKKQQQLLLPYLEDGSITLIAATTENPYHNVYDAILSRCTICNFKRIEKSDIATFIRKTLKDENITDFGDDEVIDFIAQIAAGDVRRSLNTIELALGHFQKFPITKADLIGILPSTSMSGFDTDSEVHYNLLSALQKSIRGSDADASIFYLTRLLEGGDILSPCRRLLVIACEDIGLADPHAISMVYACTQSAQILGLPEAYKPLVQATIYLAMARKSSTNETSYFPAIDDVKNGLGATVPTYLRKSHSHGYKFPHNYPDHWVEQQYLPSDIANRQYYHPGDNPVEQSMAAYMWDIKHKNR